MLRAAAVPVAGVRRPGAAEAEGLPLPHVVRRGRAARARGRRADLRRAGRQGQDDHAGQADRAARRRRDPAAVALRAAAVEREGDPAPEDAAGRDLRRADAGRPERAGRSPRAASCRRPQVSDTVELDEILRSFDPETRAASRTGCRRRREAISGRGRDLNDALGNLGPFAEDTATIVDILNRQEERRLAARGQHRDRLPGADRARRPAALADRELEHGVRDDGGARRRAAGDVPGAADVRARVADHARAADRVRRRHRSADHAAAAGRARALADARGPRGHRARPARTCSSSCSR